MKITVIIPVKNGEATLAQCLSSIFDQSIADQLEVIILDSGSTDASVSICAEYPVQMFHVNPSTFNHGLTRNFGVSLANARLVYFTVQDAYIAERDTLSRMLALFDDHLVQAVVGMQATPNDPDKNPAVWFKRISKPIPEVRHFPDGAFLNLDKNIQYTLSSWDNVNAMYRRSALKQVPFKNTTFSEDWVWANDALRAGMRIIRDPSLVVYHYHHQGFKYTFKEQFILHYNHWKFFKRQPKYPTFFKPIINATYRILRRQELNYKNKFLWILHNLEVNLSKLSSFMIFRIGYYLNKQEGIDYLYHRFVAKNIPQGKQNK